MFKNIKFKIKKNYEIFGLIILIIFTIISTGYFNYKKNYNTENYQNFIESIQTNSNMQPDFYQGAKIQKIIDKCFESHNNGKWVHI